MKKLIAFYRTSKTADFSTMIADYNSKKDFKSDIRGNGYRLIGILNEQQVNEVWNARFTTDINFRSEAKQASYETKNDIKDYVQQVLKVKKEFNLN